MSTNDSDDRGPEYSIFVGDLGPEVNEYVLVSLFQARFPSCKSAKIMTDAMSGQSRGYGFVRFSDENDQQRALVEMQGVYCGNRPMRISTATPKNRYVPPSPLTLFFYLCACARILLHFNWSGSLIFCQPWLFTYTHLHT